MIVSTVSGRIRVRSKYLKSSKLAADAARAVEALPGVTDVRVNAGAGCIVVLFDATAVDVTSLEDRVEAICMIDVAAPKPKGNKNLSRRLNQATKVGMMSTLAASVALSAAGKKGPHIAFGAAFLGFAGLHMWRYSNRLLQA